MENARLAKVLKSTKLQANRSYSHFLNAKVHTRYASILSAISRRMTSVATDLTWDLLSLESISFSLTSSLRVIWSLKSRYSRSFLSTRSTSTFLTWQCWSIIYSSRSCLLQCVIDELLREKACSLADWVFEWRMTRAPSRTEGRSPIWSLIIQDWQIANI